MFDSTAQSRTLALTSGRGISFYLIRATALLLLGGIAILLISIATDNYRPVELYFDYLSTPFLVACALAEVYLSQRAAQIFAPGEPLRLAWQVIRAAAIFHAAGLAFRHLLGMALVRSPLVSGSSFLDVQTVRQFQDMGYVASGVLQMALLSVGFGLALRTTRRLTWPRMTVSDYALLVPTLLFACYQVFLFSGRVMDNFASENFVSLMDGATNPLLTLLLFQALMIFRSLRDKGGELIAGCWRAFAAAIVLTCLGTLGEWAANYSYLPWPYSSIVWYVWLPAAAAYALAPAYQLEAAWALRVVELKTDSSEELEEAPAVPLSSSERTAVTEGATAIWEQALSEVPTLLGKLVFVSECRLRNSNHYGHATLRRVPADIATGVIRDSHSTVFIRWLALGLEEKFKDLAEYLEPLRDGGVRKSLLGSDWPQLVPSSATKGEKLLFETDVAVVLELIEE